jgi:selenocysteine-specific elongation factor
MHVVATAGHVDHGKSTLVHALTGIDPDRFEEEKRRGLTIDLGFAWATLPSGRDVGFVDVPGHVRFIKNMLAGVGGVDACLFVVAATEGWKPQSEEHLRILEMLGIGRGLVALTKVAAVDDEWRLLARMDLSDRLAGTFLAGAAVVEVDAVAGRGVEELVGALDDLLAATPEAVDRDRPRLWIDRAFAARGSGTVVTGTLAGGSLAVGDELDLLPQAVRVRVRALQTHKTALEQAGPGRRLAVNLSGVAHHQVARGNALVQPAQWEPTRTFDASLSVLASLDHDVSRRGAYTAYIGSGEYGVRIRILGTERLPPGATAPVRVHLPVALPLLPGDRYVLREAGRLETVGGGEILDVAPALPASRARPSRSVDRVIAERGWVDADFLERVTGERREPSVGSWVVDPQVLAEARERLRQVITAAGPLGLDAAVLGDHDRAVLPTVAGVRVEAGRARVAAAEDPLTGHPYLAALEAAPFSPPAPEAAGAARAEVRELVRRGAVVERDGVFFAASAVAAAADRLAELLAAEPDGVSVARVRDALGTTRKYLLPLLGELDARGVTRRRGDVRVAGPRLPRT